VIGKWIPASSPLPFLRSFWYSFMLSFAHLAACSTGSICCVLCVVLCVVCCVYVLCVVCCVCCVCCVLSPKTQTHHKQIEPVEQAARWAKESMKEYQKLLKNGRGEEAGIHFPITFYLLSRQKIEKNAFRSDLLNYRCGVNVLGEEELVEACGGVLLADFCEGEAYDSVVVDSRKHAMWLMGEIERMGGRLVRRRLNSLSDAFLDDGVEVFFFLFFFSFFFSSFFSFFSCFLSISISISFL